LHENVYIRGPLTIGPGPGTDSRPREAASDAPGTMGPWVLTCL
jgi:hypothetical protein